MRPSTSSLAVGRPGEPGTSRGYAAAGILLLAPVLSLLLAVAAAGAAPRDVDTGDDEPKWTHLLIAVSAVERGDPPASLQQRVEALAREVQAADDTERARLERKLARLREDLERKTGWLVLGWASRANDRGHVVETSKTMTGVYLGPTTGNRRALAELESGARLLVPRRGLEDLFSCGGRHYWRGRGIARSELPPDASMKRGDPPVPETPDPAGLATVDVALVFQMIKQRESGPLHRYTLKINAPAPPPNASVVRLWLRLRAATTRDETLGPVHDCIELRRSGAGTFAVQRSWEIRATPPIELRPDGASVEVVAVDWN